MDSFTLSKTSIRKVILVILGSIIINSITGCGTKHTISGDEFSARPRLQSALRIVVMEHSNNIRVSTISSKYSLTTAIESSLAQKLPSIKIVSKTEEIRTAIDLLGRVLQNIDPDSLAAFGARFQIDALAFGSIETKRIGLSESFGSNSGQIHRLTIHIIETNSGELIGYGSLEYLPPLQYSYRTRKEFVDKVVSGITLAASSDSDN